MITRVWHGWAPAAGADAYQEHFRTDVLRNLERVAGFRGAQLWRREDDGQVEFVAVTTFDSVDDVRERCAHYEVAEAGAPGRT
ncbi:MAG: hypothetical protein E6J41_10655 [Chloroflexi bacterium]|nr:MAG: hypothetical protein E6J41_10655 [Chloroflexota bacterium]